MKKLLNIINPLHKRTSRDYIARMVDDKVHCMKKAREYEVDYWDGDRRYGYGGYSYDGRWKIVAENLIKEYNLPPDAKILDIGCGKGFLLYEFKQLLPECELSGIEISKHAIADAKTEVKENIIHQGCQEKLPFADQQFNLVYSNTTLHNLKINELADTLLEIERVGKNKFICVESYRSNQELFNLQCWALTCEAFFSPEEWVWLYEHFGYTGDYEFIFFE